MQIGGITKLIEAFYNSEYKYFAIIYSLGSPKLTSKKRKRDCHSGHHCFDRKEKSNSLISTSQTKGYQYYLFGVDTLLAYFPSYFCRDLRKDADLIFNDCANYFILDLCFFLYSLFKKSLCFLLQLDLELNS